MKSNLPKRIINSKDSENNSLADVTESLIQVTSSLMNRLVPPFGWCGHIPFASWLVKEFNPSTYVELGTHTGNSFFAVCQAVRQYDLKTKCYAVDHWQGDEHAGYYGDVIFNDVNKHNSEHYSSFSTLVRSSFEDAVNNFADGSIDLLHIDGLHTYEAVKNDFYTWLPKLSSRAIVIFHDTCVYQKDFGVWNFWSEIIEHYPQNMNFPHSHGLGVLKVGDDPLPKNLNVIFSEDYLKKHMVNYFINLGQLIIRECEQIQCSQNLMHEKELANLDKANLREIILERESQINSLNQELESQINPLNQELESQIKSLSQELESQINSLNQERDRQINSLNLEIVDLNLAVSSRDSQINSLNLEIVDLNLAVSSRDSQINSLNQEVNRLNTKLEEIDNLNNTIASIFASRSWQITKPFRFVSNGFKFLKKMVSILPLALTYKGGVLKLMRLLVSVLRHEGINGFRQKVNAFVKYGGEKNVNSMIPGSILNQIDSKESIFSHTTVENTLYQPKVSVVVPNYNHASYLMQRLDSIYGQTYSNFEVILLDDFSNDSSTDILKKYASEHSDNTTLVINERNSGGVFNQWKKGLEIANGELVWIAESDDFCDENFLETMVPFFQNKAVMLSFARTDFVSGEPISKTWTSEEYLSDLSINFKAESFIKSAHETVKSGWVVKNIVPNVSSTVFRNPGKIKLLEDPKWLSLRMCGDWVFYLHLIRGGLVAYSSKTTNYYRQHKSNTSVNTQGFDTYYIEHEVVGQYLVDLYNLCSKDIERQRDSLYKHWCHKRGKNQLESFNQLYNVEKILNSGKKRKPNLLMAIYAFAAGGGETLPIFLANWLKNLGYGVTILNFRNEKCEPEVLKMVDRSIPILEIDNHNLLEEILTDLGMEIVHSHHASIDMLLANQLYSNKKIKHVVSMHGMYELMKEDVLNYCMPILDKKVSRVIYSADKNILPFSGGFRESKKFSKIDHALPTFEITKLSREDYGISPEDFVICLVSRAIPEKGWSEAIEAVVKANKQAKRKIHLLLVGNGPEYERLNHLNHDNFIHFLGFRANVRDYYALSDIGLVSSRFKGESYPLVIIDCLISGKPVLASNIGEIESMLSTEDGMAGVLYDLDNWAIPIDKLSSIMAKLADDKKLYQDKLACVEAASQKFNPSVMLEKYEEIYLSCVNL
jgi:glycosyltransferase involved in cell wall biosynthesis